MLFYILAAITGVCALAVVVTQNIVRAAAWLLFTLAGVSGVFFLLGADFVGATQLLVYVGGTLVLVVFGVMLTAQGPFINMRIGAAEWAIALAVGLLLYGVLAVSLRHQPTAAAYRTREPGRQPAGEAARQHRPRRGRLLGDTQGFTPERHITGVPGERSIATRTPMRICCPLKSSRSICWSC